MPKTLINNYSQAQPKVCHYFQALVIKQKTWFFVATLRSFEHLCFDRTLEKSDGRFEFFVPAPRKDEFVALMRWYELQGIVSDVQELPNRLAPVT